MDLDEDKTYNILAYGLCEYCENNIGEEKHTCPYKSEIFGDDISVCNCCEECTNTCANDI